jgi:WD40 repeat protein
MSKTISHQLLAQIGDPRKMTQRNIDAILAKSEQSLNIADKGLTNRVLSTFIPHEGASRLLSFDALMDHLGTAYAGKENSVQTVLDVLTESNLLSATDNCDYRISSNVLATQLFNKIEAEQMMIRKVENFIRERFTIYQEKNLLLTQPDLNYITPYLGTISIPKEETTFIQQSKEEIDQKKRRRAIIISLVITILSVFALIATWQYLRANKALKVANEATLQAELEKAKAEELSEVNADLAKANAKEAESNRQLADANKTLAQEAQKKANTNALLASANRILAEKNKAEAERNASLAFQNAKYAKEEARRAEEFEQLATKNADLAKQEAERAAREKELADKNKVLEQLAFSRTLANQAIQLGDEQAELKALMAHTAFQINKNTVGGNISQQDIYAALYQSVKSINQAKGNDDFNKISNERGSIRAIAFAKKEKGKVFYTISSSGFLKKWTVSEWKEIDKPVYSVENMARVNNTLNTLSISDDQKWLVLGGELPYILVYNLADINAEPLQLSLHEGKEIFHLEFIPNSNKLLTLGTDKTIRQYNLNDNSRSTIVSSNDLITAFTLTEDAPYLLYYGTIKGELFENNLAGQQQQLIISRLLESPKKITAIDAVFYDNRRQLFIGHADGLLKILEANIGGWYPVDRSNVVMHFISRFHTAQIADIQHSVGGHYIAITSYDGRSSLWDVYKAINDIYYQPLVFSGDSWATAIGISDWSAHVIVGYREGDLLFFNPDSQLYAEEICRQVNRTMTQDEWDLYIGKTLDPKTYRETCK